MGEALSDAVLVSALDFRLLGDIVYIMLGLLRHIGGARRGQEDGIGGVSRRI